MHDKDIIYAALYSIRRDMGCSVDISIDYPIGTQGR